MDSNDPVFAAEDGAPMQDDLRQQISGLILDRAALLTWDTVAVFPFTGTEMLEPEYCNRVGHLLVQLTAVAVREGKIDSRSGFVADLHRVALERALSAERVFAFVYLLERTVMDELALSDTIGATSEHWPVVAQVVRRASFDLLAAYTDRLQQEPVEAAIVDRLTTLYTRVMLEAVLAKELEGAGRFGHPISLILFDVDHLSTINKEHGYGVGDRILERLGILIRKYFRQHDWVARYSEDAIVVLLPRTEADNASELAERVRATVEERLGFKDHRNDQPVKVTVSAAVVNLEIATGDVIDPERLMADAEAAVERAKQQGRNRVERVDGYSVDRTAGSV
ncbi:MAG TPA: GGDEF domain-containing protein [Vicinamibacterales bacterium]|jgi:diguanylate cyclase (GGDEF)-like protein|nr:GGDEF domain-containing protein [Vicinamibacterales bacterium]